MTGNKICVGHTLRIVMGITIVAFILLAGNTGSAGVVWTWGDNTYGQLGDGTNTNRLTPVQVSGLADVIEVAGGYDSTIALKNDGTVWAWGLNAIVTGNYTNITNITNITVENINIIYISSSSVTYSNTTGISNISSTANFIYNTTLTPAQVSGLTGVTAIAAGNNYNSALMSDGTVWNWGWNSDGTILIPVQVSGLTGVTAIAGNDLALKSDGTVWTWSGTSTFQVSGLSNVIAIASGELGLHKMALKNDGTVWTWGFNAFGQLGDGTNITGFAPVQVSGLSNVIAIAAGYGHSLALTSDGTVWSWGLESFDSSTTNITNITYINMTYIARLTPFQVSGLNSVTAIAGGGYHSIALMSDGSVWTWGGNSYGQLGDGMIIKRLSPAQVSGLSNVTAIAAGGLHSMALEAVVPISGVSNLQNITYAPDYINWTWTDPADPNFAYVKILIDDIFMTTVPKGVQFYNATGLAPGTAHTIGTLTVDTSGNINQTCVCNTASTSLQLDTTPPAGVTGLINMSYAPDYINWTWIDPADPDFAFVKIWINGTFITTVPKGTQFYNATGLTLDTPYIIDISTVDANGNINQTQVEITTRTAAQEVPAPIVIIITSPANNSISNSGDINVTVTLDRSGTAILNWDGGNESMDGAGTSLYKNKTGLLSGNFSFKVYATDPNGITSVSETRIIKIERAKIVSIIDFINTSTFIVNTTLNIIAPSGNVTVTIPNGTNASVNGKEAMIIFSIDSLAKLDQKLIDNLSTSDKLIGENLSIDAFNSSGSIAPDSARFKPDIQIRFNYTDEQVAAAGLEESSLYIKFYNTTTNIWEALPVYQRDTALNFIIVNISHFSTLSLAGTQTSTRRYSSSGGGGGKGKGGGVTSSEPSDNVLKSLTIEKNLISNTPVVYDYSKMPELGIYEINVTDKETENDVSIRLELLKGISKLVTASPPGKLYNMMNVWPGSQGIKGGSIRFKVDNTWITGGGGDVKLLKWDASKWIQLGTVELSKDTESTYFEAKSDGLGQFAVIGMTVTPTATPEVTITAATLSEIATQTATPAPKASGFEVVLAISVILAVYLCGCKRSRRRR